ncbi:P-loop containing nucleoside triphosphate hydrolase protein [Lenzites betulinus]|nr:P-loop containing nucleoside triphosphate hydrolase protein [Lenzites betulinus]
MVAVTSSSSSSRRSEERETVPVDTSQPVHAGVVLPGPPNEGLVVNEKDPDPESKSQSEPAVAVNASEPAATEQLKPVSFLALFKYATRTEVLLNWIGIFAAIGAGAAQPLMTFVFGRLTQNFVSFATTVSASGDAADPQVQAELAAEFKHTAALNASYLVYIGIGMFVCTYIYMVTWVYTGEVNAKRIRERYFRAVLRQDVAYFDNVGAGEITTRIQGDTHLVQQGISEKVALTVSYVSSFVTGYVVAYVRSWRLALAMTSILPCTIIAATIFGKFIAKTTVASLQYGAESGTLAEEVISTVRTVHAFGIQRTLFELYNQHVNKSRRVELQSAIWQGVYLSFWTFLMYASYALAFNFGTTLINHGESNAGDVVSVILAILIGSIALAQMAPESQAIVQACGAAAKLYATIERVPSIDSASPEGLTPDTCTGEVTFENVDFNYPSRPDVAILKDLSITFPAGKTSALVGASGSGKSTIIALTERFYDPLSGVVKLDGVDIKTLNIRWLRSQIGLVSQEPVLFSTTIRNNVAHGLIGTQYEHAPEDEKLRLVKEACIMANADGFVSKLPEGYDTVVGERGFLLSGGQKQRIAIARAIVSDPRVLLLDEATSALDTQSEGIVQNALEKAAHGRTTITIAHRLSTIRDADCIYVMENGVVVESGTHADLLLNGEGAYSRLVAAQKLREGEDGHTPGVVDNDADTFPGTEKDAEKQAFSEPPSLRREKTEQSVIGATAVKGEGKDADGTYSMTRVLMRLIGINRDLWLQYVGGALGAIGNGAAYPAMGVVFALGIDGFADTTNGQRRHDGDRNALWFFVIALAGMLVNGLQHGCFGNAAVVLSTRLRSLAFRSILRQDIEFFDKEENNTGQLTASLSGNAQKVQMFAGLSVSILVQCIGTLVIGVVLGIIFAWQIGLVGLACTPIMLSAGYVRLRVVVENDLRNRKAHEVSSQLACEAAGAVRTIASLTREEECCQLYNESLEEPFRRTAKVAIFSNAVYALTQAIIFWVIALVFWYGSLLVSEGKRTTFQFFVGLMSTTFSATQVGSVFSVIPDIASAKNAAADILKLLDAKPTIDVDSTEGAVVKDVSGRIEFRDVHFRYPTRPDVPVLRGFSITVEPGTYVALVGASGCGKSTTVQLIERFYEPRSGGIYLDNKPITELNVAEYRKNIALVSQEPNLYAGTVRFNVLLGATKPESEVTQEEIETACRNANILEFIQSLPDGFNTEVGGKGSQLSGGQKQRIAIARALLRNPKVLLLDEATSALDSTSEKVVQEALDVAAKGRTTIAIAHRLSTIQNADRIYFIRDGVVTESGTHEELLALGGGYHEYVQLQAHG